MLVVRMSIGFSERIRLSRIVGIFERFVKWKGGIFVRSGVRSVSVMMMCDVWVVGF